MRAEDVAREHQFREGFTLVDFAQVGLPIFRLTLEAITTAPRAMPTIQEFAMRCMALGEGTELGIARMLGLKEDIIRGAVNSLVLDGLVARTVVVDSFSTFVLTPLGEERLMQEAQEVIQEEMLVIDYDAMRRTPIRLAAESAVRAAELKLFGAVEIRPYPSEPPEVSELAIPEVSRAIRRQSGQDFRRNVLALKRIVRRNNVFREGVALVFAADKGDEIQVAFAIDGKLSDTHERAFAQHGGPRKMGFMKMLSKGSARRRLERRFGREAMRAVPDAARTRAARKEEADARGQVRLLEAAIEGSRERKSTNKVVPALAAARERVALAKHTLDVMDLRQLVCFEQDELLLEATRTATRLLIVTSAGLQRTMLTEHLMRDLDRLMSERVAVQVASFLKPQTEARKREHYDPLAELTKHAHRGRMQLLHSPPAELFFLIRDDNLAVVSNRPFLGDVVRRSGFQRVEGIVARNSTLVERIRDLAVETCRPRSNG